MPEREPQPQAPDLGENVQEDPAVTLTGDPTTDPLDAGYVPPDRPYVVDEGTTAEEQREGESLDERLSRERPDVDAGEEETGEERYSVGEETTQPRAGRLVTEDEGSHPDDESDAVAHDTGIDGGAASAEEAAVRETDEP